MKPVIYTIGHGNYGSDEICDILRKKGIAQLWDCRTFPTSKYNLLCHKEHFEASCKFYGLEYFHRKELGGYFPESYKHHAVNLKIALQEAQRINTLKTLNPEAPFSLALMCSETDFTQCHRYSSLANILVGEGYEIRHIHCRTEVETIQTMLMEFDELKEKPKKPPVNPQLPLAL